MIKNCIDRPPLPETFVTVPCPTLTDNKLGFEKRPKKRLWVSFFTHVSRAERNCQSRIGQLFIHVFSGQSEIVNPASVRSQSSVVYTILSESFKCRQKYLCLRRMS